MVEKGKEVMSKGVLQIFRLGLKPRSQVSTHFGSRNWDSRGGTELSPMRTVGPNREGGIAWQMHGLPFDAFILNKFGIYHSLCKRLEANDPRVRNDRPVGIVDGTRVGRLVSL